MFPAVELAHCQQIGAKREIAGMARVGDVAVGLHCLHQAIQAADHASPLMPASDDHGHDLPLWNAGCPQPAGGSLDERLGAGYIEIASA